MRWLAFLVCAGCRLGFDSVDVPGDGLVIDSKITDAPPNAMVAMLSVARDTYVSQDMESGDERPNNFGGDDTLKIKQGEDHALIGFDIPIPSTATIFSVELMLVVTDPSASAVIELRPLQEEWSEGSLQGGPGACNWTQRNAVGGVWATVGAAPPLSAGSIVTTFQPSVLGPITIPVPASVVQTWLDPSQNHGLLLIAAQDDVDIASSEATASTDRPILAVTYVP